MTSMIIVKLPHFDLIYESTTKYLAHFLTFYHIQVYFYLVIHLACDPLRECLERFASKVLFSSVFLSTEAEKLVMKLRKIRLYRSLTVIKFISFIPNRLLALFRFFFLLENSAIYRICIMMTSSR